MCRIGIATCLVLTFPVWSSSQARVKALKTPHGGNQPQALVDDRGAVHLLYFKGDPRAGDLFYARKKAGEDEFAAPIRVNSGPGSAIAVGTVRGGQIALGKGNRPHVVWNGSGKATVKGSTPVLYSRLDDAGTAFEEQRDLRHHTDILDGGCSVAADPKGNVYVAWHAVRTGDKGEEERQVWLARSSDEGKTFKPESPAWKEPTGVCACCSMRVVADSKGAVHMLYRAAIDGVHRDVYLLSSRDGGATFTGAMVDKWKINACPMSTFATVPGPRGVVAAWDTQGKVFFATVEPGTSSFSKPQSPPAARRGAKHPAVAFNTRGEMILVWAEGTGWMRGGSLAWQVYDREGNPTSDQGRIERAIPVWGLPTVIAERETFTVLY